VANNKPQAVLISVKAYEKLLKQQKIWNTEVDFGEEGIDAKELLAVHDKI